jgi:hypothetical protein
MSHFRILRILALIAVLAVPAGWWAAPAHAQAQAPATASPEAIAAANELFGILSVDMMKQLTAQMTNLMWPMLEKKARDERIDDATIAELRKEFDRIQVANLTEIMKQAPPIYARHFSVDELHELIAFYRSPTGAKALHELPQVMGEFVAVIAPRMQEMQRQSAQAFEKILRAHGYGNK